MLSGKVLFAVSDGSYVIKLVGDVRLDLCTTIDDFLDRVFADPALKEVIVDLCAAEQIDSTTLGMLAKLSNGCRDRLHEVPTLICANHDLRRFLLSMGFEDVFHIIDDGPSAALQMGELPTLAATEEEARERIIAAHRALMEINETNRQTFTDLVETLESDPD